MHKKFGAEKRGRGNLKAQVFGDMKNLGHEAEKRAPLRGLPKIAAAPEAVNAAARGVSNQNICMTTGTSHTHKMQVAAKPTVATAVVDAASFTYML